MVILASFFFEKIAFIWLNLRFYDLDSATMKFSNDAIRRLIGPLGVLKRKIEEETGQLIHESS